MYEEINNMSKEIFSIQNNENTPLFKIDNNGDIFIKDKISNELIGLQNTLENNKKKKLIIEVDNFDNLLQNQNYPFEIHEDSDTDYIDIDTDIFIYERDNNYFNKLSNVTINKEDEGSIITITATGLFNSYSSKAVIPTTLIVSSRGNEYIKNISKSNDIIYDTTNLVSEVKINTNNNTLEVTKGGKSNNTALPIANINHLGMVKSVKTGTASGKDYNVEVNTDGTMKVNVPWEEVLAPIVMFNIDNDNNVSLLDGYGGWQANFLDTYIKIRQSLVFSGGNRVYKPILWYIYDDSDWSYEYINPINIHIMGAYIHVVFYRDILNYKGEHTMKLYAINIRENNITLSDDIKLFENND